MNGQLEPTNPDLRASDEDRDRIAGILGQALATGRLTSTEHAERLETTYTAKTVGELAPIVTDLPAETAAAPLTSLDRCEVTATMSKVIRRGKWIAGRYTTLNSRFGALIVNLEDAVLPGREITLEANSFCGKLIIVVPEDAQIIDDGSALFSKRSVTAGDVAGDGPVIRVTGKATFGKVVVRRAGSEGSWWGMQER